MRKKKSYLSAATCLALALFSSAQAAHAAPDAGVVGTGSPASCNETALNAALSGGGTITFNCGGPATITVTSEKKITQDTVIDGGGVITISGGLTSRIFTTDPGVTAIMDLRNLTLEKAFATGSSSGAAIRSFGSLVLDHVNVLGSVTPANFCGAGALIAGPALVKDSLFANNAAGLGGGAICVRSLPTETVIIQNTQFSSNNAQDVATGFGGAVYADLQSRPTIIDSVFLGNIAHLGGAVYVGQLSRLAMQGTPTSSIFASKMQLTGNRATDSGGGLFIANGGAATLDRVILSVNSTPTSTILAGYGGAIANSGLITLTSSILSHNAGRFGGAMFVGNSGFGAVDGAKAVIEYSQFLINNAAVFGGGLYSNADPDTVSNTVTISNSIFNGNSATTGGGLTRFNTALRIANSSFTYNSADAQGGGMALLAGPNATSGPYVQLRNVTVSNNSITGITPHGGGIFNSGRAELYGMTIYSNTNGVYSGANGNTRFRNAVLQQFGLLNCDGDGTAQISDDQGNYSTDSSCALFGNSVVGGADPKLAALTIDDVSNTFFHALLAGSPLIDKGFSCQERDQLGAMRVGPCDIGAVEFGGLRTKALLPLVSR